MTADAALTWWANRPAPDECTTETAWAAIGALAEEVTRLRAAPGRVEATVSWSASVMPSPSESASVRRTDYGRCGSCGRSHEVNDTGTALWCRGFGCSVKPTHGCLGWEPREG